METETIIRLLQLGGVTAGLGLGMYVWTKYNYIKRTVGWDFINSMGRVKMGNQDLVLRIKLPSGKEQYQFVKISPLIEYTITQNGKEFKRNVIYDERAVDRLNGIPILNCSPEDVRPIDRETGLFVKIPSEVMIKLAVDSSKTYEDQIKNDKLVKMLVWGLIGAVILVIVGISYINQTNSELQVQLAQCAIDLGKSATVVGQ
jgi:hypothetical protein